MDETELAARIRDALHSASQQIDAESLRPAVAPSGERNNRHRRARWLAPLIAAAVVVAVIVTTIAVTSTNRRAQRAPAGIPGTPVALPSTPSSPVGSSMSTTARVSTPPPLRCELRDVPCNSAAKDAHFYLPLWPFANYAQAERWRTQSRTAGLQPWHADPGETALDFTRAFLGFTDITTVTSRQITSGEAHIGVGYPLPTGQLHTAAVLHLFRYGASDGGWEVVGSDDTTFSLSTPAYGSMVSSPLTAGGRITGVDESIRVVIRDQSGNVVGNAQPLPAGGTDTPWSVTAAFTSPGTDAVVTIVASTGGHLTEHERFAIQGVHT